LEKNFQKFKTNAVSKGINSSETSVENSSSSSVIHNEEEDHRKFLKQIEYDISSEEEDMDGIASRNSIFVKD
jgi:hypothetical protein